MYSKHSYSLFPKVTCIMGRIFSPRFGISETIWGRNSTPERTDGVLTVLFHHNPPSHFSKQSPKTVLVLDFWYSILNTKGGPLVWYSRSWGPTFRAPWGSSLSKIDFHLQKSSRWLNQFLLKPVSQFLGTPKKDLLDASWENEQETLSLVDLFFVWTGRTSSGIFGEAFGRL